MSLRNYVFNIISKNQNLGEVLAPVLRRTANIVRRSGNSRLEFAEDIWDMYVRSYSHMGLYMSSPMDLTKYDVWDVNIGSEGAPVAFTLFKESSYGLKSSLSGYDGSSEGKAIAVNNIREKFRKPGIFGEVSSKVKAISISSGAPVVCAAYVSQILGVPVIPEDDGLHYKRGGGFGTITKIMVGYPRGVPVTDFNQPECPLTYNRIASGYGLSDMDPLEHLDSLLFD